MTALDWAPQAFFRLDSAQHCRLFADRIVEVQACFSSYCSESRNPTIIRQVNDLFPSLKSTHFKPRMSPPAPRCTSTQIHNAFVQHISDRSVPCQTMPSCQQLCLIDRPDTTLKFKKMAAHRSCWNTPSLLERREISPVTNQCWLEYVAKVSRDT